MASYDEIAKAYVTLLPTLKGGKKGIEKELGVACDKASKSAGNKAGSGIASGIVNSVKNVALGNILANGISSAVGAVANAARSVVGVAGDTMKEVFTNYSDYEQLSGGVETLFKNNADIVKEYSEQAFMTANMSANDYLNTVTSFSASLIAGLGGDTQLAADYADRAIVDMADNANKMGTSMESIQYAYQGFAKQNYTMLDNLKLGYGGTTKEMARLINDSGVLGDQLLDIDAEDLTDQLNALGFPTIIDAIHRTQESLGIAGATGEEALGTIEGSIKTTKAAWSNWLTGLGRDDVDMSQLTDNFMTAFEAAAKNVIPRIGKILGTIIRDAPELINSIKEVIPELMEEIFSALNDATAGTDFAGLGDTLRNVLGILHEVKKQVFHVLGEIYKFLKPYIDKMVEYAPIVFDQVKDAVKKGIDIVLGLWERAQPYIEAGISFIIDLWNKAQPYIQAAMDFIQQAIDTVGPIISDFFAKAQDGAGKAGDVLAQVWEAVQPVVQALQENVPRIWAAIQPVLEAVGNFFMEWWSVLGSWIEQIGAIIMENLPGLSEMVASAIGAVTSAIEFISPILTALIDFLAQNVLPIVQVIGSAVIEVAGFLLGIVSSAIKTVFDIIKGVFEFLKDIPGNLKIAFETLIDIITWPFRTAFNLIAEFWNNTVGQLQWDVPDWVPGIGGQTVGAPKLPMLADGGIVTKATRAIIGEAGPEEVIPLDSPRADRYRQNGGQGAANSLTKDDIAEGVAEALSSSGFGLYVNGKQLANVTRSDYNRVGGSTRVYNRRGLAYA